MKRIVFIIMIFISVIGCKNEIDSSDEATLEKANRELNEGIIDRFEKFRYSIAERGNRPDDIVIGQELEDILMKSSECTPGELVEFWELVRTRLLGQKAGEDLMLSINEGFEIWLHYDSAIITLDSNAPNYRTTQQYWEMNRSLVNIRVLDHYLTRTGLNDISFSSCCDINVATNFSTQNVGKPTSIILNDLVSNVDTKFEEVEVFLNNNPIPSEKTEMKDILMVNFTPKTKGNYIIKFKTSHSSLGETFVQEHEFALNDFNR